MRIALDAKIAKNVKLKINASNVYLVILYYRVNVFNAILKIAQSVMLQINVKLVQMNI